MFIARGSVEAKTMLLYRKSGERDRLKRAESRKNLGRNFRKLSEMCVFQKKKRIGWVVVHLIWKHLNSYNKHSIVNIVWYNHLCGSPYMEVPVVYMYI